MVGFPRNVIPARTEIKKEVRNPRCDHRPSGSDVSDHSEQPIFKANGSADDADFRRWSEGSDRKIVSEIGEICGYTV